jgi:hypothetical protein
MEKINPYHLVRVGNFSFRPADIKSIAWHYKNLDDRLETEVCLDNGKPFAFKASDMSYWITIERLAFVSDSTNWLTELSIKAPIEMEN